MHSWCDMTYWMSSITLFTPLYSNILQIYTQDLLCVRHCINNTIYLVTQERNISLTLSSAPPCTFRGVFSSKNVILMLFSTASLTPMPPHTGLFISVHWNNTMLFSGLPNSSLFSSVFPTHVLFLFSMSNTDLCMSLPWLTNLNDIHWYHHNSSFTKKNNSLSQGAHSCIKHIHNRCVSVCTFG